MIPLEDTQFWHLLEKRSNQRNYVATVSRCTPACSLGSDFRFICRHPSSSKFYCCIMHTFFLLSIVCVNDNKCNKLFFETILVLQFEDHFDESAPLRTLSLISGSFHQPFGLSSGIWSRDSRTALTHENKATSATWGLFLLQQSFIYALSKIRICGVRWFIVFATICNVQWRHHDRRRAYISDADSFAYVCAYTSVI